MSQQNKVTLVTPVTVPRYGICAGCGKKFQLGGSNIRGYTVPAHHASNLEQAKQGEHCPGGDTYPSAILPS